MYKNKIFSPEELEIYEHIKALVTKAKNHFIK